MDSSASTIRRKIQTLVAISASHGSSISSHEILLLLPPDSFASAEKLEEFVTYDVRLREELIVVRGEVAPSGSENLIPERAEQFRLSLERTHLAKAFSDWLVGTCPQVRLVAISGSTAYGTTKTDDDIDFFIVTDPWRLWITLLIALAAARVWRMRNPTSPRFCFNRLLEEGPCREAFRSLRDPLFAREALNIRVLRGRTYYRSLLRSARWIEELFPSLFCEAVASNGPPDPNPPFRRSGIWSLANWFAFAGLAPYLKFVGLVRNVRLGRRGNAGAQFRILARPAFFAYESRKFDLLRDAYRRAF